MKSNHIQHFKEIFPNEIKRFNQAIKQLKGELLGLKKELKKNKMGEYGSFIDVQLAIINDPKISKNPLDLIKNLSKMLNGH